MKIFNLFLMIFLSLNITAQAPQIQWEEKFGFVNDDEFYTIARAGGSYAVGGMKKDLNDDAQGWLISISDQGITHWDKKFNFNAINLVSAVAVNTDYSYMIGGFTYEKRGYRRDLFYMKLSTTGAKTKKVVLGGKFKDGATDIIPMTDGGNLILGYFTTKKNEDIWAIRVNKFGTELWQKKYDFSRLDYPVKAGLCADRSIMLCANSNTKKSKWDVVFLNVDRDTGIKQWEKTYGDEHNNEAYDFTATLDDCFVFCGSTEKIDSAKDFWVVKIDNKGEVLWENTFGWNMNEVATGIYEKYDGNLLVCGYTESKGMGKFDFWIMELDKDGNLVWEKTLGTDENDVAHDITETDDGGIIVVGSTFNGENKLDGYIIKLK